MYTPNIILKSEKRDSEQKKGTQRNPEENHTNHAVDTENAVMKIIVKPMKLELL